MDSKLCYLGERGGAGRLRMGTTLVSGHVRGEAVVDRDEGAAAARTKPIARGQPAEGGGRHGNGM